VAAEPTLRGRVALVTGASRGIGRAIARRLSAHGAAVALSASPRSVEALNAARDEIRAAGGRAESLVCELADAEARGALVARAEAALGAVDILINNAAGISAYAPPSKIDLAARRAMFELNLQAPIDLIQQALPGMRARGWGRIVNLSSDTSTQPPIPYAGGAKFVHALALYGASKAALDRYTTGLAAELHGSGVHVNALLPYKIARSESAEQIARQTAATHPDWVEPLELMAEAAYLLVAGAHQGEIAVSRALLQRCQQPLHALDGETVIGDALSLVQFS
jgi:NAD(P)-dependent dehydrogenase (short-subunit alcohol dehydrogenase family)